MNLKVETLEQKFNMSTNDFNFTVAVYMDHGKRFFTIVDSKTSTNLGAEFTKDSIDSWIDYSNTVAAILKLLKQMDVLPSGESNDDNGD